VYSNEWTNRKNEEEYKETIHLDPDICGSSSFAVKETIDTTNI